MTSFTRKLYNRDPKAAEQFHQQQSFEHRMSYGKYVTLACFTPAHHAVDVMFGKRQSPPTLPAYECWSPSLPKSYKAVVRAPDSFQARKEYAAHHGIDLMSCYARVIGKQS